MLSVNSGRCLDVTDWSTANGARIQQWGCQGGANQQWIVQPAGNGFSTIVSAQSGKALDVSDWSLDNGAPISLVQQTLGHGNIKTTSIYAHAKPGDSSALFLKRVR